MSRAMTSSVALAAAQITGWPPNVVMCPSIGSNVNFVRCSVDDTSAPTGIPPPSAFPSVSASGTTPKRSKAHSRPVRPMPHWISSKISSAPTSVHRARSFCRNAASGTRTPASLWMVSVITPAVCSVIWSRPASSLKSRKRTSGRSGSKAAVRALMAEEEMLIDPCVAPWYAPRNATSSRRPVTRFASLRAASFASVPEFTGYTQLRAGGSRPRRVSLKRSWASWMYSP
mmetsp:Transcript_77357/g.129831  ORF Transcript_77357/g.129831 Transcript_77357/m.129831 type:complete len:229 (-) Transcript_77357:371-1057(-)